MLKTISEHLTQFFPKALGIYRLGGDEFLVLANSYTREELDIRLNYLIQYSHANPYYKDLVYSFSYGIAFYDSSTMSGVADLVAKADELMYQMKRKNKASQ